MMTRLLFVDDDATLLKAIERNLCFDYELRTAESGQLGLDTISSQDAFTVVITDMKMPQMNGIQFIEKARQISPDSIYIMLTGNQDVDTAIGAINDGSVFRFLNKPCPISDIKSAVDAGIRQHQLIHSEKELLQKTFVGAVNVLTDVLESLRPEAIKQSQRVDQVMRACENALGGTGSWEFRLAGRVGLVGFALLPREDQELFLKLNPGDSQSCMLLERIANSSAKLIDRIPRLQGVSKIIQLQTKVDGSALGRPLDFCSAELGATLLRIAIHWTTMTHCRISPGVAIKSLRRVLPEISGPVEEALLVLDQQATNKVTKRVSLADLVEGMVLSEDACSSEGGILLRRGQELTCTMIEKFRMHFGRSEKTMLFLVEAN